MHMFDSSKWWHRLRGHKVGLVPFDPSAARSPILSTIVVHRCTCSAEWVFYGLTMTETFVPASPHSRYSWCNGCGYAVYWDDDVKGYFHVANPARRAGCVYADNVVPNRAVRS